MHALWWGGGGGGTVQLFLKPPAWTSGERRRVARRVVKVRFMVMVVGLVVE